MEWVVTTGRTVEEAKDAALDQLGVDHDEAEFEIVEEPKTGLFGRVRSEAQVRARIKPTVPRPKVERRERRRRGKGEGEPTGGGAARPRGGGRGGSRDDAGSGAGDAGDRDADRDAGRDAEAAPAEADRATRPPRSGRAERPPRADRADRSPAPADGDEADGGSRRRGRAGGGAHQRSFPEEIANMTEQQTVIVDFVKGLVEAFDLEATFDASATDEEIAVNVVGDDLGLLIGPRGATLQSIQDLSRAVLQRHFPDDRHARVRIDVGGYRERRRAALERFVHTVADEVRSSGKQKALEPMSSADRKVVHDTANDLEGIRTISEGYEPNRRVVILPDDAS